MDCPVIGLEQTQGIEMGEYAHDAMRQEIRSRHGFDIGEYDDAPKKHWEKIVYQRVKCPHCDAKPKEAGLWQHVRDVHGISKAEQTLAKVPDNVGANRAAEGGPVERPVGPL